MTAVASNCLGVVQLRVAPSPAPSSNPAARVIPKIRLLPLDMLTAWHVRFRSSDVKPSLHDEFTEAPNRRGFGVRWQSPEGASTPLCGLLVKLRCCGDATIKSLRWAPRICRLEGWGERVMGCLTRRSQSGVDGRASLCHRTPNSGPPTPPRARHPLGGSWKGDLPR